MLRGTNATGGPGAQRAKGTATTIATPLLRVKEAKGDSRTRLLQV